MNVTFVTFVVISTYIFVYFNFIMYVVYLSVVRMKNIDVFMYDVIVFKNNFVFVCVFFICIIYIAWFNRVGRSTRVIFVMFVFC